MLVPTLSETSVLIPTVNEKYRLSSIHITYICKGKKWCLDLHNVLLFGMWNHRHYLLTFTMGVKYHDLNFTDKDEGQRWCHFPSMQEVSVKRQELTWTWTTAWKGGKNEGGGGSYRGHKWWLKVTWLRVVNIPYSIEIMCYRTVHLKSILPVSPQYI